MVAEHFSCCCWYSSTPPQPLRSPPAVFGAAGIVESTVVMLVVALSSLHAIIGGLGAARIKIEFDGRSRSKARKSSYE